MLFAVRHAPRRRRRGDVERVHGAHHEDRRPRSTARTPSGSTSCCSTSASASGAIIGTQIANLHDLRSFQVLYLLSGLLALADAAMLFTLRRFGGRLRRKRWSRPSSHARAGAPCCRTARCCGSRPRRCWSWSAATARSRPGSRCSSTSVAHLSVHVDRPRDLLQHLHDHRGPAVRARRGPRQEPLAAARGGRPLVGRVVAARHLLARRRRDRRDRRSCASARSSSRPARPSGSRPRPRSSTSSPPSTCAVATTRSSASSGASRPPSARRSPGCSSSSTRRRAWTLVLAAGAVLGGVGLTTMRRVLTAREDGRELAPSEDAQPAQAEGAQAEGAAAASATPSR